MSSSPHCYISGESWIFRYPLDTLDLKVPFRYHGPLGTFWIHLTRHAICHGCTDIIHVKYIFFGINFCSEHTVFCRKKCFCRILRSFSNHILIKGNKALSMDVYYVKIKFCAVLSKYVACWNLRVFWVKNYSEILSV